jgi:AbrB family looped-hinge helix DNA binding protein
MIMSMARLTSKGQVTVPVDVRKQLGLEAGSRLDFRVAGPARIDVIVRDTRLDVLFGIVPTGGVHLSVEEIRDAIGDAAAEMDREALV